MARETSKEKDSKAWMEILNRFTIPEAAIVSGTAVDDSP